ncbi:cytochrome c [Synechococcus sp. PCC 7335]|uniref:c-type cytochrome n=1 Tax=Synechococcus sp. (strain ATCC 29403 / PCC 7335) TaxID=91464 RepID=UPI001D0CE8CA|nr:cytochrome c [Synechococcus sp. PCC 7335]
MTKVFQKRTVPNQAVDSPIQSEKDLAQSAKNSAPRVVTVIVGLIFMLGVAMGGIYALTPSDPYVQDVLQLPGNASRGHDIFQLNCATCHGLDADGEVGPDLHDVSERRSRSALITQVISGQTPPMPQFQPNERDMADLLAFLETL